MFRAGSGDAQSSAVQRWGSLSQRCRNCGEHGAAWEHPWAGFGGLLGVVVLPASPERADVPGLAPSQACTPPGHAAFHPCRVAELQPPPASAATPRKCLLPHKTSLPGPAVLPRASLGCLVLFLTEFQGAWTLGRRKELHPCPGCSTQQEQCPPRGRAGSHHGLPGGVWGLPAAPSLMS